MCTHTGRGWGLGVRVMAECGHGPAGYIHGGWEHRWELGACVQGLAGVCVGPGTQAEVQEHAGWHKSRLHCGWVWGCMGTWVLEAHTG